MSKELTDEEKQVIRAMARHDMKTSLVCTELSRSTTWVVKRINTILGKTGLHPGCFYELIELLELAGDESSAANHRYTN